MEKMYYMLDEKELEIIKKASKMTYTDYQLKGNSFPMDSFISIVEDLMCEIDHLQEELEDMERDMNDNYRPLSIAEQVGITEKDFIS